MFRKLLFLLVSLVTLASCDTDHDHERPYNAPYYNGHYYYYHDGRYYEDEHYTHPYVWDVNHYYKGRIEWKGDRVGHAIVLRENPYNGLVCVPSNLYNFIYHPYDGEVMVRFAWYEERLFNGSYMPYIDIIDIYYTGR